MSVEYIIPYRVDGGHHRPQLLDWVCDRLPDYWIAIDLTSGPWSKGATIWQVLSMMTRGVIVLHDADVWCPGLDEAVDVVASGKAKWARPHGIVHRLTEHSTLRVLGGEEWRGDMPTERTYRGMTGGGIVVARREALLEAPVDPRFLGWGQEDECHAMALWCLYGPPWQGVAPLVHLWHPPAPRLDRRVGSRESWALRQRYVAARHDPGRMRSLLAEARDALTRSSFSDSDARTADGVGAA